MASEMLPNGVSRLLVFRAWCRPVARWLWVDDADVLECCEFADSVLKAGHDALGWRYGSDGPIQLTKAELKLVLAHKQVSTRWRVWRRRDSNLVMAIRNRNTHCYNDRPITCTYVQAYTALKRARDVFGGLGDMLDELSIQATETRNLATGG